MYLGNLIPRPPIEHSFAVLRTLSENYVCNVFAPRPKGKEKARVVVIAGLSGFLCLRELKFVILTTKLTNRCMLTKYRAER